jgi:hypothetical protein
VLGWKLWQDKRVNVLIMMILELKLSLKKLSGGFMELYINMKSKRMARFLAAISFFFISIIFPITSESIKFIDVDEFNFVKGGQKAGLRVCVFDTKTQKYDYIGYYTFPTTASRRPSGVLLENFYDLGLEVDFNGNVEIKSSLENVIVRTKGEFQEFPKSLTFIKDDQTRNLAFLSLRSLSPNKIGKFLNSFKKGKYGKSDFQVSFYSYPTWTREKKSFGTLSQDGYENNQERKIIGELATRVAFFSCGYFHKFSTQDGSNQGIDGIYAKRNKNNELAALFLTEYKCQDNSPSPKKIMKSQLNESILNDNIGRLESSQRSIVLDFIDQKPDLVFKGAHRILIDGTSEWLVKPLGITIFRTLKMGISSPEKDKEAFIEMIAPNFRSPEEALRVLFAYYHLDEEQQLDVFYKATGSSPETLSPLGAPLAGPSKPRAVIPFSLSMASSSEGPSTLCKQDPDTFQITGPSSSSLQFIEQPEEIIKPAAVAAEQETRSYFVQDIEYNRENLAKLLTYIKGKFKRCELQTINEELKKVDPNFVLLNANKLSCFSNYKKYFNRHTRYDYENLWKLLLEAFPDHYQQAIVKGAFKEEN